MRAPDTANFESSGNFQRNVGPLSAVCQDRAPVLLFDDPAD
jgi:hypothetical protein